METNLKVFWVNGWDSYYPRDDNFIKSFHTLDEARTFVDSMIKDNPYDQDFDHFEIINITERLL